MLFKYFLPFIFCTISFFSLAEHHKVAIVIDDIGYRQSDQLALSLPGDITYAVLPHTPFGKLLANQVHAMEQDVLLHIPMESSVGKKLGPGALTSDMGEQAIRHQLDLAFQEIPFAIGINNHMGSHLTKLYSPMAWTMRYLKANNRMFLDSLTTGKSRGEKVAKLFGVPSLHRHVFLDNQLDEAYITQQFENMIKIAKVNEHAVAIAHPHPETIAILTKLIPTLAEHDIELVGLSDLLQQENYAPNIERNTD